MERVRSRLRPRFRPMARRRLRLRLRLRIRLRGILDLCCQSPLTAAEFPGLLKGPL